MGFKLDLTISLPPVLCDEAEAEDGVGREEAEDDTDAGVLTAEGGTVDCAPAGERTIDGPIEAGAPAKGDDSFFEYAEAESPCPPIGTTVKEGTAWGATEEAAGEVTGVKDCGPAVVPALGDVSFFENESALVIPPSLIFDGVPGVCSGGGV